MLSFVGMWGWYCAFTSEISSAFVGRCISVYRWYSVSSAVVGRCISVYRWYSVSSAFVGRCISVYRWYSAEVKKQWTSRRLLPELANLMLGFTTWFLRKSLDGSKVILALLTASHFILMEKGRVHYSCVLNQFTMCGAYLLNVRCRSRRGGGVFQCEVIFYDWTSKLQLAFLTSNSQTQLVIYEFM